MNELLLVAVGSVFSSLITWFFTRRKQKAEVSATEVDNVEKAAAIWRESAEYLKKELEQIRTENSLLREEMKKLENRMIQLTGENKKLRQAIEQQR